MMLTKNPIILSVLAIVFLSCTPDPYEGDKARVAKFINTVGDTELLRDVAFEKFDVIESFTIDKTVIGISEAYDTWTKTYIGYYEGYLSTDQIVVKNAERGVRLDEMLYKRRPKTYADDLKDSKKRLVKAKEELRVAEAKVADAKNDIFDEEVLSDLKYVSDNMADFASEDGIVGTAYAVIYIVDKARVTKTFTVVGNEVADELYTAERIGNLLRVNYRYKE